jgi:hypothetical protein
LGDDLKREDMNNLHMLYEMMKVRTNPIGNITSNQGTKERSAGQDTRNQGVVGTGQLILARSLDRVDEYG